MTSSTLITSDSLEPTAALDRALVAERLLVITSVVHYRHEGRLWAYGPYVRELEVWCDLCSTLELAAAVRTEQPPGDALPIARENVVMAPVVETGGSHWTAKLWQLLLLPWLILQIISALRRADAVHVRCPGNLGLLGVLLAPLFTRRLIAKYAGQWTGYPGEAITYRWQRWLLGSRWWNAPVTVYGQWPNQRPHVIPFFSTAFTNEQLARAQRAAAARQWHDPPRVLFVGRLSAPKHVATLLAALGELKSHGLVLRCSVVGEGPELDSLRSQATRLGLEADVIFTGGVKFDTVLDHYEQADILVLASETEGFPKAILEGMAFGLVCIGSNRGFVPTMLREQRGWLVEPGSVQQLATALSEVVQSPHDATASGQRAARWASRYSLGELGAEIRRICHTWWPAPPRRSHP
jgi:glycosyltransferase involved in cell wall biosynthesis